MGENVVDIHAKSGRFQVCCFWDPAIDRDATDLDAYVDKREFEILRFRPPEANAGLQPQIFVLRDLPNAVSIDYVLGGETLDVRRRRAFQASIVMVKNARLKDGRRGFDWEPPQLQHIERKGLSKHSQIVRDSELDLFHPVAILEIGEVALTRAFLEDGMSDSYLLPPTSRRLLFGMTDLYAAYILRRPRAGKSGEKPSEGASGSGSGSEEDGDATATEPDPTSGLVRSIAMSRAFGEESNM